VTELGRIELVVTLAAAPWPLPPRHSKFLVATCLLALAAVVASAVILLPHWLADDKVQVLKDGKALPAHVTKHPEPRPAPGVDNAGRLALMDWVAKVDTGGYRGVKLEQYGRILSGQEKVNPARPFMIRGVSLHNPTGAMPLADDDLAHLSALPEIEEVDLTLRRFGPAGLAHLAPLVNLKKLRLIQVNLPVEAAQTVRGFTKLESLGVPRVTEEWLPALAGMTSIKSLYFYRQSMPDRALACFKDFPSLVEAEIVDCATTEAGLLQLKEAKSLRLLKLDRVRISDGVFFERLAATLPWCEIHHTVGREPTIYNPRKADVPPPGD
jgi:hypothetical protein